MFSILEIFCSMVLVLNSTHDDAKSSNNAADKSNTDENIEDNDASVEEAAAENIEDAECSVEEIETEVLEEAETDDFGPQYIIGKFSRG